MLALARSETIMSGAYLYPFLVVGFYIVASPSGLGEGGGNGVYSAYLGGTTIGHRGHVSCVARVAEIGLRARSAKGGAE